jgi:hypothetical protein
MPPAANLIAASLVLWVTASILLWCYRQLWGSVPRHVLDDFLLRLIPQLRTLEASSFWFEDQAHQLAQFLEGFLVNPRRDLYCTGNDDEDREIVAAWLDRAARQPPFLAPTWTRNFSEWLAWVLRHHYPITEKSLDVAARAVLREYRARWERRGQQEQEALRRRDSPNRAS